MSSLQELIDVPFLARSQAKQNSIIRQWKLVTDWEDCFDDEQQKRFLSLKLAQYDWLVLEADRFYCWPCVLMPNGGREMFNQDEYDATWSHMGVPYTELTPEKIQAHLECDLHQLSAKSVERKRKKLAEKASSGSSTPTVVYGSDQDLDCRIVEAHLNHLSRNMKSHYVYMTNPNVGFPVFYRTWLKAYPEFKETYVMRSGVLSNLLKLNQNLTNSITEVMRDEIKEELASATYVSVLIEDMGQLGFFQPAIFTRAINPHNGYLYDRFLGHLKREGKDTRKTETIMQQLNQMFKEYSIADKLVSLSFTGIGIENQELVLFVSKLGKLFPRVVFSDSSKISHQLVCRLIHVGKSELKSTKHYIYLFALFLLGLDAKIAEKARLVAARTKTSIEKIKLLMRILSVKSTNQREVFSLAQDMKERKIDKKALSLLINTTIIKFMINLPYKLNCSMSLSGLCTLLHTHRVRIIKLLQEWSENEDGEDCADYGYFLADFFSLLLMPIFTFILKRLETTEDRIRKQFYNWNACEDLLRQFESDLKKFKTTGGNYEEIYREAVRKTPEVKQASQTSKQDSQIFPLWSTANLHLKSAAERKRWSDLVDFAIETIVKLVRQFRFDTWKKLSFFNLVNTSLFERYTKEFPQEHFESLAAAFPREFRLEHLKEELNYLYQQCHSIPNLSVEQFVQYFTTGQLKSSFPESTKLALLVHTIPARIFPAISAPRVTSRLNVQEVFHELYSRLTIAQDGFFRCEWPLFRELKDRETFHRSVVDLFFRLYHTDPNTYSEQFIRRYDPDREDNDGLEPGMSDLEMTEIRTFRLNGKNQQYYTTHMGIHKDRQSNYVSLLLASNITNV